MLTLFGMLGDHPPKDAAGFDGFARSLQFPDLYDVIRAAEPIDDPVGFRFPANVRRRYERMRRFPDGLLVVGDAICSFNPIYGQGMTVAALQAIALRDQLRPGTTPSTQASSARSRERSTRRGSSPSAPICPCPKSTAPGPRGGASRTNTCADSRLPPPATPSCPQAFVRVTGLIDPPEALLRPATALRVLRPRMSVTRRTTARAATHRTNG